MPVTDRNLIELGWYFFQELKILDKIIATLFGPIFWVLQLNGPPIIEKGEKFLRHSFPRPVAVKAFNTKSKELLKMLKEPEEN